MTLEDLRKMNLREIQWDDIDAIGTLQEVISDDNEIGQLCICLGILAEFRDIVYRYRGNTKAKYKAERLRRIIYLALDSYDRMK